MQNWGGGVVHRCRCGRAEGTRRVGGTVRRAGPRATLRGVGTPGAHEMHKEPFRMSQDVK